MVGDMIILPLVLVSTIIVSFVVFVVSVLALLVGPTELDKTSPIPRKFVTKNTTACVCSVLVFCVSVASFAEVIFHENSKIEGTTHTYMTPESVQLKHRIRELEQGLNETETRLQRTEERVEILGDYFLMAAEKE